MREALEYLMDKNVEKYFFLRYGKSHVAVIYVLTWRRDTWGNPIIMLLGDTNGHINYILDCSWTVFTQPVALS